MSYHAEKMYSICRLCMNEYMIGCKCLNEDVQKGKCLNCKVEINKGGEITWTNLQ